MIVNIDTDSGSVTVNQCEDCKRLSANLTGVGSLTAALASFGKPDNDGEHLWIDIAKLRAAAAPAGDAGWLAQYEGMIRYAASKGWVDESTKHVRVHIDRNRN